METKAGITGRLAPFDASGVLRGADGRLQYAGLHHSLVALLRDTATRAGGRTALVEVGTSRTLAYDALWDAAARVAGGLAAADVVPGDRVAILLPNGIDWALAWWGALLAGAIVVPVNTRLAPPEVAYVLEDAGVVFAFQPEAGLPDGPSLVHDTAGPEDVASIIYTSGTTGAPKGAMTTHGNFLANIETVQRSTFLGADEDMRMLISVPLFHVTGLNSQLLPVARLGATAVVLPHFDLQVFLDTIVEHRCDCVVGTPAMFWLALHRPGLGDRDMGHVRWAMYGGAPMPPEEVRAMRAGFPRARLANAYGMTETSSVTTVLPDELSATRPETVGLASPIAELDLDRGGAAEGPGELLVRSAQIVAGYWNKPEATARAFTPDGWLRTGDVATIDADGFVTIVDRIKDLINRGGENVYSIEVENAIALHPAVGEVSVLGVPDPVMGEKVGAVVVAREGQRVDADALLGFLRGRLADFKIPQYVVVRDEPLPRNPGGKIVKGHLRDTVAWGEPVRDRARD